MHGLCDIWCIKPPWAQSQVLCGQVPQGLDWATCVGLGSWHILKSGLANPKLLANQIIDTPRSQCSPPHLVQHTNKNMSDSAVMNLNKLEIEADKKRLQALVQEL
ncbi:uncharacterized protein PGTG_12023 [Puccinia graminis f. sp. tritici CRL 75-36-700-3]|uniref:Uncharacterized protein n=1 Tax=Puccinia graminis f. sp. tritici (strain CRL 75-36-700-3 / race SCCL) TaxID=418459 RepID=E3KP42_PUCGT|nr:uncharacterized protein PGTG_12023 [Puccinia graminis f. sp. tritici CRL 75-36-700-3]EFP86067.2 hypothetical protein PGTG_12023 [Puccinia graminis f. sp. tritici CRL 75-36-700-3]